MYYRFQYAWVCLACLLTCSSQAAQVVVDDESGKIVIETTRKPPEPQPLFSAQVDSKTVIESRQIGQQHTVKLKPVQGKVILASLEFRGPGEITNVQGDGLKSWGVRRQNDNRYLDLYLTEEAKQIEAVVQSRTTIESLPSIIELTHFAPGDAIGFSSTVAIDFSEDVRCKVTAAEGFASLETINQNRQFLSNTGGRIAIELTRDQTARAAVELTDTSLVGALSSNNDAITFQWTSTAEVIESNTEVEVLSGNAAVRTLPESEDYRLVLDTKGDRPLYKLVFLKTGSFPVNLEFIAPVLPVENGWNGVEFKVAASAIVPMKLEGLASEVEFQSTQNAIIPQLVGTSWSGFLPANGRVFMEWKSIQKTTEGKLFFTTSGQIEAKLGAGLLRQDHKLDYQVLQGELNSLTIKIDGPGEILDVQGDHVLSWTIEEQAQQRSLEVALSQPYTESHSITVRSQAALAAFPIRVAGLSLQPIGSIRHSGFLRLSNLGLVRIEPVSLVGLAQLSPEQFPGEALEARQVFVYRFPAAEHSFEVAADRIQPEVNVAELTLYQLTETDRRILTDVELDIREAPIRDWNFSIPQDYSVVSVTGSSVADYVVGTTVENGRRNLSVIFSGDVQGRQLVTINLEKSETAATGQWQLQRIEHPDANAVRGDIGVLSSPGFRLTVATTDMLIEKPVSYFPKSSPSLQQAFRMREPNWSATLQVELLDRSVQADVFHLYSLSKQTVYGSALVNYFVTGSPVSEWVLNVPQTLGNVTVDGQDVRTWRREGDNLVVTLHQGVMGAYTLLITFEQKPDEATGEFSAGQVTPMEVQGERGFVQVVSPRQVELTTDFISDEMLKLDPLELPAEFRLLSSAPPLGTWQYTSRPFRLDLRVDWFKPGTTVTQVVEFSEANSRVSKDGELVTDILYYVKSRGERTLRAVLPAEPVRLWEVIVNGQPVSARLADNVTLIPLPGNSDPNIPVEVRLRLGKPAANESGIASKVDIELPVLPVPVLKTQWNVIGDEQHVLVPSGGTVATAQPPLRPTGWEWIGQRGLLIVLAITALSTIGVWGSRRQGLAVLLGLLCFSGAVWFSGLTALSAFQDLRSPDAIELNLPVLAAGESLRIEVDNVNTWQYYISWLGVAAAAIGILLLVSSFAGVGMRVRPSLRVTGLIAVVGGALMQRDAAPWFFACIAIFMLFFLVLPTAWRVLCQFAAWFHQVTTARGERTALATEAETTSPNLGAATSTIIAFMMFVFCTTNAVSGNDSARYKSADQIEQKWQIVSQNDRLTASGTISISGKPGDQFVLLNSPATLIKFEGEGLRLGKHQNDDESFVYVITIQKPAAEAELQADVTEEAASDSKAGNNDQTAKSYIASFEYQIDAIQPLTGIPVLTGLSAVHSIVLTYDQQGLQVVCDSAVKIESTADADRTEAKLLLGLPHGPEPPIVRLKPLSRDLASEQTQFYVEASNLYIPGPGVVDGVHAFRIRTSRGQIANLEVTVPQGLTVSSVNGPVGSWQFDADSRRLALSIEPKQTGIFDIQVTTQRGLDPLPVELELGPLRVEGAVGEVGLLAVAFGSEAQPDQITTNDMSIVNLGDFDASLMGERRAVLHRAYRYGADGGTLNVSVGPVAPDVRVVSKQILSYGDERVVLAVNFAAEITRAGLFQLSFLLPDGLEVESLTGPALHHWSEVEIADRRRIILHLNGKTLGANEFALTLSGNTPNDIDEWQVPKFEILQAERQTGELVVRPTTGIRLRTVSRQNVSETDPRTVGGQAQGALAFRLLQKDWNLALGIEKLDPWITGEVLQEITLREGQTRTVLLGKFDVENASIRSLQISLPINDAEVIKTLRATGEAVSDLVRTGADSNVWEVRFKRRIVGKVEFRIEYEQRGTRENDTEYFLPAVFPETKQLTYHVAIRSGGRLELGFNALSDGWQRVDWNTVATSLRQSETQSAPVFTMRVDSPAEPLVVRAERHSLADALKLRIANAQLTTVLSPTGDQLTAVEAKIEVTQRGSLSVGLPDGGELFSIFVNGESVNSIRLDSAQPVWQFNILPGIDERTAELRFVYTVPGSGLRELILSSPKLDVPMENIQWDVVAPTGYQLTDHDGNLELKRQTSQSNFDRESYLSKVSSRRQNQAKQAEDLLEQANQMLQAGQQSKARWAFNSVANQYALDAASNEDARVQLENLQTQQAVVGLNTRRQRLMLDNSSSEAALTKNSQFREAAAQNPLLQQNDFNYRPQQISQLLQGNTTEDNAVLQQIANRLVQHQHGTELAPQAIVISLPEGGSVYTFVRSVQVAESAPLLLDLSFEPNNRLLPWQAAAAALMLVVLACALVFRL